MICEPSGARNAGRGREAGRRGVTGVEGGGVSEMKGIGREGGDEAKAGGGERWVFLGF